LKRDYITAEISTYSKKYMTNREKQIKKFGIEIVEYDEKIWLERGYIINYETGLLEQIIQTK